MVHQNPHFYRPQSIKKTRYTGQQINQSPQRPSTSIVIRMDAIEKASQKQNQEEAKAIEQIASFVPLSATPAPNYGAQDLVARDRIREEIDPFDTQEIPNHQPTYRKENHFAFWLFCLSLILLLWALLVSLRTGFDTFITGPIEATQLALSGQLKPNSEVAKQESHIQAQAIDQGELQVNIKSVSAHKRKAWIILAEVYNGKNSTQTSIQLSMDLRFNSTPPRIENHRIDCCQEWTIEDLDRSLDEILANAHSPETMIQLSPQKTRKITWVVPMAKGSNPRDLPTATIKVSFFERADSF